MNSSEFDFINSFPPLGHPEHHFNKYPNHPWLKTKEDIKIWISENCEFDGSMLDNTNIEVFFEKNKKIINDDLTISVPKMFLGSMEIKNKHDFIPIQFRKVINFYCNRIGLKSLIGTAYINDFISVNDNLIESFDGLGKANLVMVENNKIKNFKGMRSHIFLNILGNPIESWDGFTNCDEMTWWQEEWCDKTSYDLLMLAPESVKKIKVLSSFKSGVDLNQIKMVNNFIDMKNLRELQLKEKILKTNDNINESLKEENKLENKRRKL